MEYTVDTYMLRVRLAVDGRTWGLIARDAHLPLETLKNVLKTGKTDKQTADRIRLAIRPKMHFSTLCPEKLQKDKKMKPEKEQRRADFKAWLTAEQKKQCELFEKVYALCEEYNLIDVQDAVHEISSTILCYMVESGFALTDLYDETLKGVPELKIDKEETA